MSQVRPGLLIAIIVFAVFATYAFLVPATYRASALLVVDSANPAASVGLPEPLEAARRLSEAILDRSMLEQLSRERAGSSAPEAQARAASSVRESLAIDTSDARSFSISYKDSDRVRAQRVCNQLTHHAFERAPQVLVGRTSESAGDLKRQEQTQELAAFLALHPQVAAESPTPVGGSPEKDPALSAFHAEKANLERRISELKNSAGSDNPYLDPGEPDLNRLRLRMGEIDAALSARRNALVAKPSPSSLSPELRAEWKRLLAAVTQASADTPRTDEPSGLVARIASEAALPRSPIDPNRPLLLFFGVVFGSGLGTIFALTVRAAQQRRSKSSRPPKQTPSPMGLTVQLPAAPALPSALGPVVPTTPLLLLSAPTEPPIVPIPQRQISSSPPGPSPATSTANNGFGNTLPIVPREQAVKIPSPSVRPSPDAASRFASTLVLPPPEEQGARDEVTPDPVLASAARAWDDQIRAHEVPGFAVVRPRSEASSARSSSVPPPVAEAQATVAQIVERRPTSSVPPTGGVLQRNTARNQMKVTQPLGSFMPDGVWNDPSGGPVRSRTPQDALPATRSPLPLRSPPPAAPGSTYSYVSKPPPGENNVTIVRHVPSDWRPDPRLIPASRRSLCEQLYPLAVQNCLVLLVAGTSDSLEQKSVLAAELSLALAESGHPRILLLEGDMQSPRVHRLMNADMPIASGFSQQLRGRINGNAERRWTVIGCSGTLHILAEGMMRSPGLLLSQQFSDGLRDLRSYYDIIVIDGPSASLHVESQALDGEIDGVLFVSGKGGAASLSPLESMFGEKKFKAVVTAP